MLNKQEAVEILRVVAGSLRTNPPSFVVGEISGTKVVSQGGTGLHVNVEVSGPTRGPVTGFESKVVVGGDAPGPGADSIAQSTHAAELLEMIAAELGRDEPRPNQLQQLVKQIPEKVVGAAITALAQVVIRLAIPN